jgi:hypothetical protein
MGNTRLSRNALAAGESAMYAWPPRSWKTRLTAYQWNSLPAILAMADSRE